MGIRPETRWHVKVRRLVSEHSRTDGRRALLPYHCWAGTGRWSRPAVNWGQGCESAHRVHQLLHALKAAFEVFDIAVNCIVSELDRFWQKKKIGRQSLPKSWVGARYTTGRRVPGNLEQCSSIECLNQTVTRPSYIMVNAPL